MVLRPCVGALRAARFSCRRYFSELQRERIAGIWHARFSPFASSQPCTWRQFSQRAFHVASNAASPAYEKSSSQTVTISFVLPDNTEKTVEAKVGDTILEVAHANNIELEGACEGACSCSTCHVILEPEVYDELPEPSEQEEDMLDLAACLTPTSRLGCQIHVTPDLNNAKIRLPQITRNFYVDGHVPAPH
ncbi:putative adrenodoxin-type ferredoxin [Toxoplasma gondii ARI]|uniref:2Fe-2S ferredoxin n=2 Tax=Toxoplasma gondii TaxID=5811 RepID=A0A2G8Y5K7_TOXGO|nr:putative adrenodoxin-type ferredoxin [Toxoplasma gondii ARI]PIM02553.1 putative adrenodoxin-type ferredoxin [Toxoplasma gondii COUG]